MKQFRHQQRPKKSSLFIGREAVILAIKEGEAMERIYLENSVRGAAIDEIKKLALQYRIPINYVPVVKLNAFNVGEHEGCVALRSKISYVELQDLISLVFDSGKAPMLLILDGITDIRNIGGIARTAWCLGVNGIIIPDKGVGALNEDAILTSAGALEKIPVCRVSSLMKAVDELHLNGIKVYGTEMKATVTVESIDWKEPSAIIMGSEEKGIYPALLKICDEKICIPMQGDFESLNVSVATGIILYEAMKGRNG
jgi:23S rRNA (guanosine2251-2'-O)-methyltransferase